MVAQLAQGLGLGQFVLDRSSKVEEGQEDLGKSDYHGPLSGLLLPLGEAYNILSNKYESLVASSLVPSQSAGWHW